MKRFFIWLSISLIAATGYAATLTLQWDAPTTCTITCTTYNTTGCPYSGPTVTTVGCDPIAGYKVYWGTSSGSYPNVVSGITSTGTVLTGLPDSTKIYAVATTVTAAAESVYSNMVSTTTASAPVFSVNQIIPAVQGSLSGLSTGISGTYTYVYTTTANSGSAVYLINVPTAGNYKLQAVVNTGGSDATNSVWIGFNGEAAQNDDSYTYDMPLVNVFTWNDVSKRGNGSSTQAADQYNPMIWTLPPGLNYFTLWFREINSQIAQLRLIPADNNVTITAGTDGHGTISPSGSIVVSSGTSTQFTVTPSGNYSIGPVGGTCGGALVNNLYTTNTVTQNCSVSAMFTPIKYTVTSSAGANGTISPSGTALVTFGTTTAFIVTPATGYTAVMGGTCGGTLSGNIYTINPVSGNCSVTATFPLITYTMTSSVSGGNGTISPSGAVVVNYGTAKVYVLTPSSGYGVASVVGTCGGVLSGMTYTTSPASQNCTVIVSFANTPVNGACGSASGTTVNTIPTTNLCSAGNASTVSGSGPWQWQCLGLFNGSTVACSANISQFLIMGNAGSGGSISPSSITKNYGTTTSFTLNPDHGYSVDLATGCSGTRSGNFYSTGSIVSACTVTVTFSASPPEPPSNLTGKSVGVRAIGVIPH